MATIDFKILTPEEEVYGEAIDSLTIDTQSGPITVLPNHVPLVSVLAPGEMIIKKGDEEIAMAVLGGFLEVQQGSKVIVLADSAERAEDIDLAKAEEAKKRAEELAKQKLSKDDQDYARVAAALERELAKIRVAKKHKNRAG